MGFFTAIPVGATQIEIAKRSLNKQLRAAYMVMIGSVCSDVLYGSIAFFGLAPFLEDKIVVAFFGLVGTLVLWVLAYFSFRQGTQSGKLNINHPLLKSKRLAFITGFSLAVTNPIMIFWWLVGAKIVKDLELVTTFTSVDSIGFLIFGGLGLAAYLGTLATVLHWAHKFISDKFMRRINLGLAFVLVALSIYFLVSSLRVLL
jgi:threonine/homoserine/homoserine lactone efflux protein